ncbi:MAG: thioredoxin-disulfide reductase [Desulfovibrionaceae bacterium]
MTIYDSIIIGSGPAGMSSILYLTRFGRNVAVVESMTPGGQMLLTSEIENVPGIKEIKGYELTDAMKAQIDAYEYTSFTDKVHSISKNGSVFEVKGDTISLQAKTVIIASGASYKRAGIPQEVEFTGKGVSYCALCDGNFYRKLPVAVLGGGNSAFEEALYLARLASQVHIIHRRDTFRAANLYVAKAQKTPNIVFHTNTVVDSLKTDSFLRGLVLKNTQDNTTKELPIDGLFIYVGMQPNADFLPQSLNTDDSGFIPSGPEMETNIPGLFVAGDVRVKQYRQVATAIGDGVTAACSANHFLENEEQ